MAVQGEQALSMLNAALEMEKKGKAFYERAAKTCKNELGQLVFRLLTEEEALHIGKLNKKYHAVSIADEWTEDRREEVEANLDLSNVFSELAIKYGQNIYFEDGDRDTLEVGIDFELQCIRFYEKRLKCSGDATEKAFWRRMIIEERQHYLALSDMNIFFSDPGAWFIEKDMS